jgi:hypothetical protein
VVLVANASPDAVHQEDETPLALECLDGKRLADRWCVSSRLAPP